MSDDENMGSRSALNARLEGNNENEMAQKKRSPIKEMQLYNHFERVDRELARAGKKPGCALSAEDLYALDHMNYYGTQAVDTAIQMCGIGKGAKVLDIGSGLGGPARYMASAGAVVTAVELQEDCHAKAEEYSKRCGLASSVRHVCANFVTCARDTVLANAYDCVTSWLAILHIDDKKTLFERAREACKPGGLFYIEDFCALSSADESFTPQEVANLEKDVFCHAKNLMTKEAYCALVERAGFEIVSYDDMTASWTSFTSNRFHSYENRKEEILDVHGKLTYESQLHFFRVMKDLFAGGNLGGCRIVCKKRASMPVSLEKLRSMLDAFAKERDWEQFHTPRNLAFALTAEVGELVEIFQWKGEVAPGCPSFSDKERTHLGEELSDVLLYTIRLADRCGIDLSAAALAKLKKNASKYPADRVRGRSDKYNEYAEYVNNDE